MKLRRTTEKFRVSNWHSFRLSKKLKSKFPLQDHTTTYRITSKPPGLVLLINNFNFPFRKSTDEKERHGSEIDMKLLQDAFCKMGYEIYGNKCQMNVKTAKVSIFTTQEIFVSPPFQRICNHILSGFRWTDKWFPRRITPTRCRFHFHCDIESWS